MISVTDTGGGISPEDRSRVFDWFPSVSHTPVVGVGESRMGMALVKALVEANGGRVWVDSETGVGSTFSFALPAAGDGRRHERD